MEELLNELESKCKGFVDAAKIIELRHELAEKIERDLESKEALNKEMSSANCSEMIIAFIHSFKFPHYTSVDEIRPTLLKEKRDEFNRFILSYLKHAKGPSKCKFCIIKTNISLKKFLIFYLQHLIIILNLSRAYSEMIKIKQRYTSCRQEKVNQD